MSELPEKLELKKEILHEVQGVNGIIRHWGNMLYAEEELLLESVDIDLFTEIVKRYNSHDKLLEACKDAEDWIRSHIVAIHRPATLDKKLMDAIAAAKDS